MTDYISDFYMDKALVRHEPCGGPHLRGEEICGDEDSHMRAEKLRPRGGRLALGSWRDAMALQDIAHRLVTDGVPEVGEGPHDPIVAPRAIFLRQAHHQGLQLLVNRRSSRGPCAVESHRISGPRASGARPGWCPV